MMALEFVSATPGTSKPEESAGGGSNATPAPAEGAARSTFTPILLVGVTGPPLLPFAVAAKPLAGCTDALVSVVATGASITVVIVAASVLPACVAATTG